MARRTDQRGTDQPALDETAGWPGDGADDAWQADHRQADHRQADHRQADHRQADHWQADHWEAAQGRDSGGALRLLALIAVAIGLAALTAAACVLSYQSIHVLADQARVSDQLARIYPLIFDALLVVSGCCVLALRGAGLPSKLYAWLCLIVLLAALAAGGVVHAAGYHVPLRPAEITAAAVPFALVLLGFGLLLALLRHSRLKRASRRPAQQSGPLALPGQVAPAGQPALALPAYPTDAPGPPATVATAAPQQSAATATDGPVPSQAGTPSAATAAGPPGTASGATTTDHASTAATRPGAITARASATRPGATTTRPDAAATRPDATSTTPSDSTATRPGATSATRPGATIAQSAAQSAATPADASPAARPPVRQADLQLRARIPKPAPASDASPGQAGTGPAGTGPAGTGPASTGPTATTSGAAPTADAPVNQPAPLLPPVAPGAAGLVGGQERRTSLMRFRSRKSAPADATRAPEDTDEAATKPQAAVTQTGPAGLSAAPIEPTADRPNSDDDEGTGPADSEGTAPTEPPALERPRSSPTRPHD